MKKATWLFSSVIATFLATGAPAVVSAEDSGPGTQTDNLNSAVTEGFAITADESGSGLADSIVEVNFTPGTLSLLKVPNLSFGTADVKSIISGDVTLQLGQGNIINGTSGYDGSNEQKIEVADYRGSNVGWKLSAALSNFTGGVPITADKLALTGQSVSDTFKTSFAQLDIAKGTTAVLTAPAGQGTGLVAASIDSGELVLPKTNNAMAGQYQATITWTLAATPAP